MKMIRFKQDIPNEDGLVWQRGNIYKILSEDEEQIVLESDAIDDIKYSIQRSDLNTYCFFYVCNGTVNDNCEYCRYLCKYNNKIFCENLKGVTSNE